MSNSNIFSNSTTITTLNNIANSVNTGASSSGISFNCTCGTAGTFCAVHQGYSIGSGQLLGGYGSAGGGGSITLGGGATLPQLTQSQITTILQGLSYGLSQEEQDEMKQLKVDYDAEVKRLKLTIFKKLPSDMRQHVITTITWQETITEMETVQTEKSDRLKELESKGTGQFLGSTGSGYSTWYQPSLSSFAPYVPYGLPLPTGLSTQDLKDAHLEATLEEQILDNDEETKET